MRRNVVLMLGCTLAVPVAAGAEDVKEELRLMQQRLNSMEEQLAPRTSASTSSRR